MNLLDLPEGVLLEIFEYLAYDEVAKNRLVCRRFDEICQQVLNRGFNKAVTLQMRIFKRIKSLLPRRESERRNHCLARHADILTSIETRISMLSMTYSKYMDLNLCCFIPGRVLDEIFRILHLVSNSRRPLRPHEVLQELRDISSMAIEHFDEKIANTLKPYVESSGKHCSSSESRRMSSSSSGLGGLTFNVMGNTSIWNTPNTSLTNSPGNLSGTCCESIRERVNNFLNLGHSVLVDPSILRKPTISSNVDVDISSIGVSNFHDQHGCPEARASMVNFKKLELDYKRGIVKMQRMQQIQVQQSRRLSQALTVMTDMNAQIVELKKRIEDLDAKNREISANIKQINVGEPQSVALPSTSGSVPAGSITPDESLGALTTASLGSTITHPVGKKRRRNEEVIVPVAKNQCDVGCKSSSTEIGGKKPKM